MGCFQLILTFAFFIAGAETDASSKKTTMEVMFGVGTKKKDGSGIQLHDGDLPELRLARIQKRENSGLAFGGGGMRAFIATIAAYDTLQEMRPSAPLRPSAFAPPLIEAPRYAAAVSGAAWGSAVAFFGDSNSKNTLSKSIKIKTWSL